MPLGAPRRDLFRDGVGPLMLSNDQVCLVLEIDLKGLTVARTDPFGPRALVAGGLGLVALEASRSAGLAGRAWASSIHHFCCILLSIHDAERVVCLR
jgi:hypothetical protein